MAERDLEEFGLALVGGTGGGVATSLETARPGQALMISAEGAVVGPFSEEVLMATLDAAVRVLCPGALVVLIAGALFGAVGAMGAMMAAVIGTLVWAQPRYELDRAVDLHAQGDHEAAEWRARRVAVTGFASLMVRGNAWMIAGSAAWLQGERTRALKWMRRAVADLGTPSKGRWRGVATLARLHEIQLLAIEGDLDAAKQRLVMLERDGVPAGDLVQIELAETKLVVAFESGSATSLPTDIDSWLQAVLRTNRFGTALVLLAWAHVMRRDLELVPMMLEIAADRLPECRIERAYPKLARWLTTATAKKRRSALALGS